IKSRLKKLLNSYWRGSITSWEFEELLTLLQESSDMETWESLAADLANMMDPVSKTDVPSRAIFNQIIHDERYKRKSEMGETRYVKLRKIAIAATAVVVVSLSVLYYFFKSLDDISQATSKYNVTGPVAPVSLPLPGKKQATLTMADGSVVVLDSLAEKKMVTEAGARLYLGDGRLAYEVGDVQAIPVLNTVSTPIGGEYHLILADGTNVWLNAESSITYPVVFGEQERAVTIRGEVYFEVAKNEHLPFVVIANDTRIQVLGTHFNVNAYGGESGIKTTLLEGSIRVERRGAVRVLEPGQQAETASGETGIIVRHVDTEEAVAWKNGLFMFNNESVYDAMKKISRWYDVEVVYEGVLPRKGLHGTISKMEDLSQLLQALE